VASPVWKRRRAVLKRDCGGCTCGSCGFGACWRAHWYDKPCAAHRKGKRVSASRRGRSRLAERARKRREYVAEAIVDAHRSAWWPRRYEMPFYTDEAVPGFYRAWVRSHQAGARRAIP